MSISHVLGELICLRSLPNFFSILRIYLINCFGENLVEIDIKLLINFGSDLLGIARLS